ncbi:DUF3040 domain-containing protein [Streptomyces sp. NPDC007084]|uniref:DUF3040 domain-containing protein n=1 Tax=Streptomyces sp. NPDC007084 TaxID=3154313 RepID=UPI0034544C1D
MDERDHRDGVRLSPLERAALAEIEEGLRHDHVDPEPPPAPARRPWLAVSVVLMVLCSVFLAVVGFRTSEPAILWCFAVLWPLTVIQSVRLVRRWMRHWLRPGGRITSWF